MKLKKARKMFKHAGDKVSVKKKGKTVKLEDTPCKWNDSVVDDIIPTDEGIALILGKRDKKKSDDTTNDDSIDESIEGLQDSLDKITRDEDKPADAGSSDKNQYSSRRRR